MDWDLAIKNHHMALTRIVAAIVALVGLTAARLPRPLYREALRVLRPAEAAVRRLIVIAARGVVVKPVAVRPMPKGLKLPASGGARISFQLFDARKRFAVRRAAPKVAPRIWVFGASPLVRVFQPYDVGRAEPEPGDGLADATRLGRRLQAIKMALENLPAQAIRFKRWQARRARMANPKFRSPLRPGPPPGHRQEPEDEIGQVLRECHALAKDVLGEDTS